MPSRLAKFATALLLVAAAAPAVQAQDFPNRPIRMVIAFPPGGPTDFVGRLIADKLKDILGQTVIIENKPGANGAIGADSVAKSPPDGYTLFLTTVGAVAITPNMRNDLPYDVLRDFAPVTLVVRNTTVVVVRADSPANSAKEFVEIAKKKDGEPAVRLDRRRLDHASGAGALSDRGRRQVRARALSRRRPRAHRPARRPGPGVLRRRAGADAADHRRQGQGARRRFRPAQSEAAGRADAWPSRAIPTPRRTTGTGCWRRPRRRRPSSPSSTTPSPRRSTIRW